MSKKTIHVIFKTHFDIGFTDHAKDVMENYMNYYIPKAIDLAFELNSGQKEPLFIWTTGSYLIDYYINTQSLEKVKLMEEAINKGYIAWHGIPATFHSELVTKDLFEYGLSISQKLDQKYNKHTIASKMTDVPGHTLAIAPLLNKSGIKFLHIGVNGASSIPNVPETFLWKYGDSEVIVSYSQDYGSVIEVEGIDDVLYFAHTHDNSGPQNAKQIINQFESIKKRYPNATIKASTMDAYAKELWKIKDQLPIVTEEIGDSWIHGVGSDPYKVAMFRELLRLQKKWINEGKWNNSSKGYYEFNNNLLLIPEHTWGMDIKRHLFDCVNYSKEDFFQARMKDKVCDDVIPPFYHYTRDITIPELQYTTKTWEDRSYSTYESSWAEQRDYINKAISFLPPLLQNEALHNINFLKPIKKEIDNRAQLLQFRKKYNIGSYVVSFDIDGSINYLSLDNKIWADRDHKICSFIYEAIGNEDYQYFFKHYMRNLPETHVWAYGDFGKIGLELIKDVPQNTKFHPIANSILIIQEENHEVVYIKMSIDEEASQKYGAPREYEIKYVFKNQTIDIEFNWFNKDANRLPEALWLNFAFNVDNPNRYLLDKLGEKISPLDIVYNGNRNLHGIEDGIIYNAADGKLNLLSLDAAVVAPGKPRILEFSNRYESLEKGFYFNLFNNIWGTNFVMWYEEDAKFRFSIKFN